MKYIIFNLCILIFFCTYLVHPECCHTTGIYFNVNGITKCQDFGGTLVFEKCRIGVCNDGRIPKGSYCGVGPCNRDGCDCVGGCIGSNLTNNPIDNLISGDFTRGHLL